MYLPPIFPSDATGYITLSKISEERTLSKSLITTFAYLSNCCLLYDICRFHGPLPRVDVKLAVTLWILVHVFSRSEARGGAHNLIKFSEYFHGFLIEAREHITDIIALCSHMRIFVDLCVT
jgi:hypothetical protein